jgi:hypothetical protein
MKWMEVKKMLTKKEREVLCEITTRDGFAYFSGFRERATHHPTIYHHTYGFRVVGPGINKNCETIDEAVKLFKKHFKYQ